jgi:hypothetical protein
MCIIIDTCCANVLQDKDLPQGKLILNWIKSGGKIVSGGRLEAELKGTKLQSLLAAWSLSGRLISYDPDEISAAAAQIQLEKMKSNDLHVVALARVSGAMAVVTKDKDLMQDLKKSGQVDPPRKIYPFPDSPTTSLRVQREVLRKSGCK